MGNLYNVSGNYEGAIVNYQKAVDINGENVPALYNLGNNLFVLGRIQEAIEKYLKALECEPDNYECHFNLGTAYTDLSDIEKS